VDKKEPASLRWRCCRECGGASAAGRRRAGNRRGDPA